VENKVTAGYDPERFWAERYSDIDLTKSGHADLPVEYNEWLYRRKKEILLAQLAKAGFRPAGSSVLDIAVGTGVYVEMWRELGAAKVSGVDISQNAVDSLAQRFPQWSFYKWNLASPGLSEHAGNDYPLVTALDMLYHIVDDHDFPVALNNLPRRAAPAAISPFTIFSCGT
jgi:2-polyprenyl-3-methyl-5-hydroxy-6-metoxy-1,4-benzoquinol methylase